MPRKRMARGRSRPVPGQMNKTEQRYANELAERQAKGEIQWYKYEPFRLRLADNCFYVPDFAVLHNDGEIEVIETKGYWHDGAKEKVKVAANKFWMFRFTVVFANPKNKGGGWRTEEFRGGYE